ncbi:MAG: CbiX/SirB N-terminal domain-containing protein [Gemmatimonadetes bacterium]|nr:CbiX/SirB N-terminal domain-containing protein [Gemmatimonadota bacterium]NNM04417.1 CbiX/SirB N-terminal domain-containing protein [Gemmatimonadota bacterium]
MLILVAHGSRDPHWRGSLHALCDNVTAQLPGEEVKVAFMQFDGPSLPEVVAEGVRAGEKSFRLLPLFMASAGHVDKDIKPLVAELALKHPGVKLDLMTPVGEDPLFPSLIIKITNGPPSAE